MFITNKQSVKRYQVDFHPLLMYWIILVVAPLYLILFYCYIILTWIEFVTTL